MIFMVNGIMLFHQTCEYYLLTVPKMNTSNKIAENWE